MSRRPTLPGADELFRATSSTSSSGPSDGLSDAGASSVAPAVGERAGTAESDVRSLSAYGDESRRQGETTSAVLHAVADLGASPAAGSVAGSGAGSGAPARADGAVLAAAPAAVPGESLGGDPARSTAVRHAPVRRRPRAGGERRPTGRERHEEKITVYVSAEELLDLEQARLTLRAEHGLAVDRGRIVREALAVVLADLEAKGEQSILVRRLTGR